MSALEQDPDVAEFTTSLSPHARQQYQGGQVSTAHLMAAIRLGWKPAEIARECSRDLPHHSNAWRIIQTRLEWCAHHPPRAGGRSAPRTEWCGQCADPTYRWEVDAADRPVRPCPRCSPARSGT